MSDLDDLIDFLADKKRPQVCIWVDQHHAIMPSWEGENIGYSICLHAIILGQYFTHLDASTVYVGTS